MITSLANLKAILLDKVCEVKFVRRNPKPGRPATRRMLCTNNVQLLNSVEGRTTLNYLLPLRLHLKNGLLVLVKLCYMR